MNIFFIWLTILSVALAIYLISIYRKSRRGFRFQVKLTIIFILLVLVPAIPLTTFVSALLTRSMQMFLLPGMDNTLVSSLELIKYQLEREGVLLISDFDQSNAKGNLLLQKNGVLFVAEFEKQGDEIHALRKFSREAAADTICENFDQQIVNSIFAGEIVSRLFAGDVNACEVFVPIDNTKFRVIGFEIDPKIITVKENLTEAIRVYNSLSLFKKSVEEGQLIWAFSTIFIVLLTLIAVYAAKTLSRGISEPIMELAAGMKKMAAGEVGAPVNVKAKDEIKFLIDTFNRMAQELKTSQEKLLRAERMAAWQELARRVSHEIRNSLTPIQLSLRRLWNKFEPELGSDNPIVSIQEEVESLTRLAEEFSQFARMPQISLEKANVHDIIKSVVTLVQAQPGVPKIRVRLDESVPPIRLDRAQFRRALYNVLKNAVEASQPNTANKEIFITTNAIKAEGKSVKIEIIDRGIGIESELLKKIFEPNFTTKKRGMGLGLAIVKKIIEDHDGEIQFFSTPGKGTRVTIVL
ncbi:MAG: HAMP domain-containing protein [Calditrichaeota bacterium]|nr:HAMP domain-containing protein [Calditrichota bacterium]